jgi:hypothetical protein
MYDQIYAYYNFQAKDQQHGIQPHGPAIGLRRSFVILALHFLPVRAGMIVIQEKHLLKALCSSLFISFHLFSFCISPQRIVRVFALSSARIIMKNFILIPALFSFASKAYAISDALQNILANTHKSNLYTYPTDLTREIVPVNDSPLDVS